MHFKELNTSGCNILDVILYAVSHIPKRSSGKVTLNVVTNTLQTAVCEKLCRRLFNQFLLMRYFVTVHFTCHY